MRKLVITSVGVIAIVAAAWLVQSRLAGQGSTPVSAQPPANWQPPRTPWGTRTCRASGTRRPAHRSSAPPVQGPGISHRPRGRRARADALCRVRQPQSRPRNPTGDYGSVWREGSKNALNRTSLIIDPPDGRLPPLTPAATEAAAAREAARRKRGPADDWTDLPLWTRCITRGTPRIPNNYNSNLHIVQTPDRVTIYYEMIHETRTIWLDGRPHVGPNIRLWNGDARGHWEGNTLVVDTTNFNDQQLFNGFPLTTARLIERFTRTAPDAIDYRFTIDDPATYTRPVTVIEPMVMERGTVFRVRVPRDELRSWKHPVGRARGRKSRHEINETVWRRGRGRGTEATLSVEPRPCLIH